MISDNAKQVLVAINRLEKRNGYPPNGAEMCAATGLSREQVTKAIQELKNDGLIVRSPEVPV